MERYGLAEIDQRTQAVYKRIAGGDVGLPTIQTDGEPGQGRCRKAENSVASTYSRLRLAKSRFPFSGPHAILPPPIPHLLS